LFVLLLNPAWKYNIIKRDVPFQLNSIQSQFRAWTVRSSISACLLLSFIIITITQLEAARNSFKSNPLQHRLHPDPTQHHH
jgi:hypothetical protein